MQPSGSSGPLREPNASGYVFTLFEVCINIMLASTRRLFPSRFVCVYVMSAMPGTCREHLSRHNVGEQHKIASSSSSCSSSHPQFTILRPNIDDQFARNAQLSVLQTVVPQHIPVAEQLNGHRPWQPYILCVAEKSPPFMELGHPLV
jgi:hypothetical protein